MSRKVVIQHDSDDAGWFSLAAFQTLRLEALDLFDRCLTERKPEHLERFLERQIAQELPPLELLSQVAEDVHQRLLTLRQRHFEVCDQVRWTLDQYGIVPTLFVPTDLLEYPWGKLDDFLRAIGCDDLRLTDERRASLSAELKEARDTAAQLRADVRLADYLYSYLMDWLLALHVVSARGAWTDLEIHENTLTH